MIHLLEKAELISLLPTWGGGLKMLVKVEKVYLQNPNIAFALSPTTPDIGSLRESVFFAWTSVKHQVTASPISDYEIEGTLSKDGYAEYYGHYNDYQDALAEYEKFKAMVEALPLPYQAAYAEELDRNSPRNKIASDDDDDDTTVVGTLKF